MDLIIPHLFYFTTSQPAEYSFGVHTLLSINDLYKISFHQPSSSLLKAVPTVITSGIILIPYLYEETNEKIEESTELKAQAYDILVGEAE